MRIPIIYILIACLACKEETVDCPQDIACTENYVSLIVNVTDSQGSVVSLDSYYSEAIATGEIFNFQNQDNYLDSISRANGSYVLFTDGGMNKVNKHGSRFLFHGLLNGNETISESYIIGHDCCHVVLLEGNTNIIVD